MFKKKSPIKNVRKLKIFVVFWDFVCVIQNKLLPLQKFHTIVSKIIKNGRD